MLYYLIFINAVAFIMCAADKARAKRSARRIPESTLMGVGLAGGCFGLLLGMYTTRHKTRHKKFTLGVPLECILWVGIIVYLYVEVYQSIL